MADPNSDTEAYEPTPLDDAAEAVLLELLDVPGPSGFEEPVAEVWRRHAATFADVHSDRIGSTFATVNAGAGKRYALVAHLDEIGLVVTKIDDKGFLRCAPVGGWDVVVLAGQRVRVLGTPAGGVVHGGISRAAVHVLDAAARGQAPKIDALWIDIGARDRAHARALVRVGDPVVLDVEPRRVGGPDGTRIMSRSVDDRVGCFVVLEAARRVASEGIAAELIAVGSVGEEIGMGGSRSAISTLEADRTAIVDVTTPGDTPGGSDIGALALGKGPIVSRGSTLSERVVGELVAAADGAGIPIQLRAKGNRTATDADQTVRAGAGVAQCLVSVPARYLHTPVELVDLRDIRASIDLLVAWIRDGATTDG